MTLLRWLLRLPLASLAGCGLALFAGVAWCFLAPTCGAATMAPFAGCAAPAILGLWIDWARLYPTTRRAIATSGALLALTLLASAAGLFIAERVERWIDPEPVIMGEAPIDVVDIVETDVPESLPTE